MASGIIATKAMVDAQAGGLARDLEVLMDRIGQFSDWLDSKLDAELTALGYDSTDIANLRSAYGGGNELDKLRQVYEGAATQGTPLDFRVFSSRHRLWGY